MKLKQNNLFRSTVRFAAIGILAFGLPLWLPAQYTNSSLPVLQAAADRGDQLSQLQLASDYAHGTGVPRNYGKAAAYLRQAADQGNVTAMIALGSYYGRGRGVPRNIATAVQWYRKAADQGNPLAQYAMGNFYATGRGVTNDMNQAIQWWEKAAGQDQADAEAALGDLHLITTPERGTNYLNYGEAVRWLRRAAAHGSVAAMDNLGMAYEDGFGVKMDDKEAAKWYQQAADTGNAAAQANLGELYLDGRGVPSDPVQAYKWLKLSAMQNNPLGTHEFSDFQDRQLLKPEQVAKAEQMVQDFQARHAKKAM